MPVSNSRSYSRSRSRSYSSRGSSPRNHRSRSPHYRKDYNNRARENPEPNKIIGVFGLDPRTTERDLQEYFERPDFGKVDDIQIIKDQATRRSKGFAFIYYQSIGAATRARDAMNGKIIHGKEIRVDFSTTRGPHKAGTRPPMTRGRSPPPRNHRHEQPPPNRCIGIFNLNPHTNEKVLEERFERFGRIEQVRVIKDKVTNQSKGFGFVYYTDTRSAIAAKERMDDREFDRSIIRVDFSATNARNERSPSRRGGRSPRRNGSMERGRRRSFSPRRRSRSPPRRQSPFENNW